MGRRSDRRPDELKDIIIRTAMAVIESDGMRGLSARTIARRIGYSPGTLYNVFVNLDALIFHVEVRALDDLVTKLMEAQTGAPPAERLRSVAHAYLTFAQQRPNLWSLLFEHHVPAPGDVPPAYVERLVLIQRVIEHAVRAGSVPEIEESVAHATARVVFCSLNGIAALATSAKMAKLSPEAAPRLIDELLERLNPIAVCAVDGSTRAAALDRPAVR